MKRCTVIFRLLLILLISSTIQLTRAQTPYIDSMQAWRKNYIDTHELLPAPSIPTAPAGISTVRSPTFTAIG